MAQYTVCGFHEEDGHIFCEHVDTESVDEAIVEAVKSAVNSLDKCGIEANYQMKEINIIEVFRGHLEPLNDCTTVSSAVDWPGVEKIFKDVELARFYKDENH